MRRMRLSLLGCGTVVVWCVPCIIAVAAPTVWSGLNYEFTKPAGSSLADPITPNVALTRGLTRGLYNAEVDLGWNGSGPTGTTWATAINNIGGNIVASNWEALTFESWIDAYGGGGVGNRIEGLNAVVHLVADDIYLDLRFTDWVNGQDEGGGGGFTYLRAVAPSPPTTTGDYNGNGVVDTADYVAWRNTLNETVPIGSGADGKPDGTINLEDYDFWKARFGNPVSGTSNGGVAVPEPNTTFLPWIAAGLLAGRFGRPARKKKRQAGL